MRRLQQVDGPLVEAQLAVADLLAPRGKPLLHVGLLLFHAHRLPPAGPFPLGRVNDVGHHRFQVELDVARIGGKRLRPAVDRLVGCLLLGGMGQGAAGGRAGHDRPQTASQEITSFHSVSPSAKAPQIAKSPRLFMPDETRVTSRRRGPSGEAAMRDRPHPP